MTMSHNRPDPADLEQVLHGLESFGWPELKVGPRLVGPGKKYWTLWSQVCSARQCRSVRCSLERKHQASLREFIAALPGTEELALEKKRAKRRRSYQLRKFYSEHSDNVWPDFE